MDVDLFSMTQGSNRHISFMCQSLGLMADVDLGTDRLRFMGSQYVYFAVTTCPPNSTF